MYPYQLLKKEATRRHSINVDNMMIIPIVNGCVINGRIDKTLVVKIIKDSHFISECRSGPNL